MLPLFPCLFQLLPPPLDYSSISSEAVKIRASFGSIKHTPPVLLPPPLDPGSLCGSSSCPPLEEGPLFLWGFFTFMSCTNLSFFPDGVLGFPFPQAGVQTSLSVGRPPPAFSGLFLRRVQELSDSFPESIPSLSSANPHLPTTHSFTFLRFTALLDGTFRCERPTNFSLSLRGSPPAVPIGRGLFHPFLDYSLPPPTLAFSFPNGAPQTSPYLVSSFSPLFFPNPVSHYSPPSGFIASKPSPDHFRRLE